MAQKPAYCAMQLGTTAKQWSSQKGASILSAAQAALPSISVSNAGFEDDEEQIGWRGGPLRDAAQSGAREGDQDRPDGAASGSNSDGELVQAPEIDTDPVLEAFLKVRWFLTVCFFRFPARSIDSHFSSILIDSARSSILPLNTAPPPFWRG